MDTGDPDISSDTNMVAGETGNSPKSSGLQIDSGPILKHYTRHLYTKLNVVGSSRVEIDANFENKIHLLIVPYAHHISVLKSTYHNALNPLTHKQHLESIYMALINAYQDVIKCRAFYDTHFNFIDRNVVMLHYLCWGQHEMGIDYELWQWLNCLQYFRDLLQNLKSETEKFLRVYFHWFLQITALGKNDTEVNRVDESAMWMLVVCKCDCVQ
jgi:hypothetical protein